MLRSLPLLCCLIALTACKPQDAAVPAQAPAAAQAPKPGDPAAASRIEADVRTLADDRMEGRDTGTRGFDMAAEYVAKRYTEIGLQPGGEDGTFFQRVPLLKALVDKEGASFVIHRDGKDTALTFVEQFVPAANYNAPTHALTAPAAFVGQAVFEPGLQQDDFAGVDLHGKIAVLFSGAPARFDNDRRAFHANRAQKLRMLTERGAVGVVYVGTPENEKRTTWASAAEKWNMPGMRLRDKDGTAIDSFPQLKAIAYVSAATASALFAGSGHEAQALFEQAESGKLPAFDLPGTLTLTGRTRLEPTESRNVVGRLPGSDATLGRETIAYTAHLDHIGIGAPVAGDSIYNGAMDNALGVSIMLEAARELVAAKTHPKRTLLFIALTGEEKGLLGSTWFARNPTVPKADLVANINMDMPVLLAPSRDVVPIGVEHSTLKASLDKAAAELGLALSPDPFPEEVVFVRSDQFSFVREGIPAVYLDGGVTPATEGGASPKDALDRFLRDCYHKPCDDASQPIRYDDAARLAHLNARIGALAGDLAERPRWNAGDFFGDRFGKPASAEAAKQ